jgi:hypothetical protein
LLISEFHLRCYAAGTAPSRGWEKLRLRFNVCAMRLRFTVSAFERLRFTLAIALETERSGSHLFTITALTGSGSSFY